MDDDVPSLEDFTSIVYDRGVLKKIKKEGTMPFFPHEGNYVRFHCVGTYHGGERHGELFESTRARSKPWKHWVGHCMCENFIYSLQSLNLRPSILLYER